MRVIRDVGLQGIITVSNGLILSVSVCDNEKRGQLFVWSKIISRDLYGLDLV